MAQNLSNEIKKFLILITNQLNFLLCLVNDVLDMKMIENGQYEPKFEIFNPQNVLDFIIDVFLAQSKM